MANFLQEGADKFAPIQAYTPDYSFLTKVYGTRQAEYDKGFNYIKNLYNSQLNSPLTNQENEQHRTLIFKKIQESLKSTSSIDLSNPSNIMRAQSLIDPISTDKEIAYDMGFTRFHQSQRAKMEQIKNSSDPKIRSTYSDYSAQDIAFAEEDFRNAKRGNGSIFNVKPREFVPFEDVNEYLNKNAKEQGLTIKNVKTENGYIMTVTNGQGAYQPFTAWAQQQMGDKFNRQFDVIGRVQSEKAVRQHMEKYGVSREDAVKSIATKISIPMMEQYSQMGLQAEEQLGKINAQIKIFESHYPNGVPASLKDKYNNFLVQKEQYSNLLDNSRKQVSDMQQRGVDAIGSNLSNIFSTQAKNQFAKAWGVTRADATVEVDLKPDEVVLTKWRIASNERMNAARIASQERIAAANMEMEKMKLDLQYKIAEGEGKLPSVDQVGTFVGQGEVHGVDILDKGFTETKKQAYNSTLGAGGLVDIVVNNPAERNQYYSAFKKLELASQGAGTLSNNDIAILNKYNALVGKGNISTPRSASEAGAILDMFIGNTYSKAKEYAGYHVNADKTSAVGDKYAHFQNAFAQMSTLNDQRAQQMKYYRSLAKTVLDNSGNIKDEYEGAKITGYVNGVPIINFSGVEKEKKAYLNNVVGEYGSETRPVGNVYSFNTFTPAEQYKIKSALMNPVGSGAEVITANGKSLDPSIIASIPDTKLFKEIFGNKANVSFDPTTNKVSFTLNVDGSEASLKALGLKTENHPQTITVSFPYDNVKANPALSRINQLVNKNDINPSSLGSLSALMTNPYANVHSPASVDAYQFKYNISGITNAQGQYGLNTVIEYLNPETNRMESSNVFHPMNPGNHAELLQINEMLNQQAMNYINTRRQYEEIHN